MKALESPTTSSVATTIAPPYHRVVEVFNKLSLEVVGEKWTTSADIS